MRRRGFVGVWSLACPGCRGRLDESSEGLLACTRCQTEFARQAGIWRLLPPGRGSKVMKSTAAYRNVREAEGWGWDTGAPYRRLPECASTDPRAKLWRRRRASFDRFKTNVLPAVGPPPRKIIDLGAGNGWLANRLAERGHTVAAVDVSCDARDGLGALRHYEQAIVATQADFDRLPFGDDSVDLAVFNGSLHHSPDPQRTLREALRVVGGGHIVVMDSPVYRWRWSGEQMRRRRMRDHQRRHGTSGDSTAAAFLTFEDLHVFSEGHSIPLLVVQEGRGARYRAGRLIGWLRARREPAHMPMSVFGPLAQKPAVSGRR